MRSAKQLKVITPQVEILEDLKCQLESCIEDVNNAITEGKAWMEDNENKLTFFEMNQLLISAASQCMVTCLDIGNDNPESSHIDCKKEEATKRRFERSPKLSSLKDEESCKDANQKLADTDRSHYLQKVEEMKEKVTLLEKQIETLVKEKCETDKKADQKFEEIMTELHSASDFMSHLQAQSEQLSEELADSNARMLKKISDHEEKIENLSRKEATSLNSEMKEELQEKTQAISKMCFDSVSSIEQLSAKMNKMENFTLKNLTSLSESLRADVENVKLNVTTSKVLTDSIANDHAKTNAEIQRRVTALEVQSQYINRDVEEMKHQKNKNMAVGFQACLDTDSNDFQEGDTLQFYDETVIDLQNNFDQDAGIFTVPVDGVYLCSLTIDSNKYVNNSLRFTIIQKEKSSDDKNEIVETFVSRKDTMATGVSLVHLSKDDQLYVRAEDAVDNVELSTFSQFMCVLLSEG